jgi:hypothetical protein
MIPTLKVVPVTGNLLRQLYLKLMIPTLKVVPVTDNLFIHLYLKLNRIPVTGTTFSVGIISFR